MTVALGVVVGVVAGGRAEEMAAIPHLVGGALAFWLVAVPAAAVVVRLEAARRRHDEGTDEG